MKTLELYKRFKKHHTVHFEYGKMLDDSIFPDGYYIFCKGIECSSCRIETLCEKHSPVDVPAFNLEEAEILKLKHPEEFI